MFRIGFAALGLLIVIAASPADAQQTCTLPNVDVDGSLEYEFLDSAGRPATAWRIKAQVTVDAGLVISETHFRSGPSADWIKVLSDARIAEIFVPYHVTEDARFYDTMYFSLVALSPADLGSCGAIPASNPYLAVELNDGGVLWKQYHRVARTKKLVLWVAMGAVNYNYLIAFSFGADGTIEMRAAGTAQNLPGAELEAHTHTVIWRIDVDLAGAAHDSVYLRRHDEPHGSLAANDALEAPNGGYEGAVDFADREFSELRVLDPELNGLGHQIGYDLRPVRRGAARHFGAGEDFAQHDAWILKSRASEVLAPALPNYVDGEPIGNEDVVIWAQTPLHHEPRDEDGFYRNGQWFGVALAMWGGLDLRPRNLFSGTPYYP